MLIKWHIIKGAVKTSLGSVNRRVSLIHATMSTEIGSISNRDSEGFALVICIFIAFIGVIQWRTMLACIYIHICIFNAIFFTFHLSVGIAAICMFRCELGCVFSWYFI